MTLSFEEVKEQYKTSSIPTFTEYMIEVLRDGNVVVMDATTITWLDQFVNDKEEAV